MLWVCVRILCLVCWWVCLCVDVVFGASVDFCLWNVCIVSLVCVWILCLSDSVLDVSVWMRACAVAVRFHSLWSCKNQGSFSSVSHNRHPHTPCTTHIPKPHQTPITAHTPKKNKIRKSAHTKTKQRHAYVGLPLTTKAANSVFTKKRFAGLWEYVHFRQFTGPAPNSLVFWCFVPW